MITFPHPPPPSQSLGRQLTALRTLANANAPGDVALARGMVSANVSSLCRRHILHLTQVEQELRDAEQSLVIEDDDDGAVNLAQTHGRARVVRVGAISAAVDALLALALEE
jgi:hypothetical protein